MKCTHDRAGSFENAIWYRFRRLVAHCKVLACPVPVRLGYPRVDRMSGCSSAGASSVSEISGSAASVASPVSSSSGCYRRLRHGFRRSSCIFPVLESLQVSSRLWWRSMSELVTDFLQRSCPLHCRRAISVVAFLLLLCLALLSSSCKLNSRRHLLGLGNLLRL